MLAGRRSVRARDSEKEGERSEGGKEERRGEARRRRRRWSEVILKRKSMLLPGRSFAAAAEAERLWPRQPLARSISVSRYITGRPEPSRLPACPTSVRRLLFLLCRHAIAKCMSGHHDGIRSPPSLPPSTEVIRHCNECLSDTSNGGNQITLLCARVREAGSAGRRQLLAPFRFYPR